MSVCVFLCGGVRRCVRGVPELCALFSVCRVCEFVGVTLLFFDLFCVCVVWVFVFSVYVFSVCESVCVCVFSVFIVFGAPTVCVMCVLCV